MAESPDTINFRDDVYGVIKLSKDLKPFIYHPLFRRLKEIHQLGPIKFLYKRAGHSRYDHSLGTCYLAETLINRLMFINYRVDKNLNEKTNWKFAIKLAALYHDIGHGPFSHDYDEILKHKNIEHKNIEYNNISHEKRSVSLLLYICNELNLCNLDTAELAAHFIYPKFKPEIKKMYNLNGLGDIVHNEICQIDIDKLDYLMRDYLALEPNNTNHFSAIDLINNCYIANGKLCFSINDRDKISYLVSLRFLLYHNYYFAENTKIMAKLLSDILINMRDDIFSCSNFNSEEEIKHYGRITDEYVINQLLNGCATENESSNNLELFERTKILLNGNIDAAKKYIGELKKDNGGILTENKSAPQKILTKVCFYKIENEKIILVKNSKK